MAVAIPGSLKGKLNFAPFKAPTRPPTGSYDPALDAQLRAAKRGYGDIQYDTTLGDSRANTDWQVQRGLAQQGYSRGMEDIGVSTSRGMEDLSFDEQGVQRQYGRSLADLLRDRARGHQDFSTGRSRATEDRSTALAGITRGYNELGRQQGEQAAQAGLTNAGDGSLAAAMAARQGNERLDRQPVETSFNRFMQDSTRDEGRFTEDSATTEGRLGEDRGVDLGRIGTLRQRLGEDSSRATSRLEQDYNDPLTGQFSQIDTGYQRGVDDRALGLGRAGREFTAYGQDVGDARFYQATQAGYVPPSKPKNEGTDARGPFRLVKSGGVTWKIRPNGKRERA